MILLIPSFQELNLINLTDLNSIMILLIHRPIRRISLDLNKFKFHYDSINSKTKKSLKKGEDKQFKFHYDSINSYVNQIPYYEYK